MSRDYKARPSNPPAPKRGGSLLTGIFIGLVLGIGTASVVAWYIAKSPSPFVNRDKPGDNEKMARSEAAPQPASSAEAGKSSGKPRFDFYKILPGSEEPVAAGDVNKPAQPTSKDVSYYLQAGSFQKKEEADNMKAKLAMLGVEAAIEPSNVPDKGMLYRVRIGPYSAINDLKKIGDNLQQNGIASTVVKTHEAAQ